MIVNLHIREDYRLWYPEEKARVKTMCGKKTTPNTAGIPGIDEQPVFFKGKDSGWCLECCNAALEQMTGIVKDIDLNPDLFVNLYYPAMNVCAKQLIAASYVQI